MKKLLILVFLTIPLFLFLNSNYTSATNSLDIIDDYFLNDVNLNEDYQNGYSQGYEDGFSHKNRVKIALWQHDNIQVNVLTTVYRFDFLNFVGVYGIISSQGLTTEQIKNKIYIPTFNGHVGTISTNIRQWILGTSHFYLSVEKPIIEEIMIRDGVNEINALKTYLQENNINGYFERASGETDYQIGFKDGINATQEEVYQHGYDVGYIKGYKDAFKDTTVKLISSILILISPILLISVILQMLNKFKNDN